MATEQRSVGGSHALSPLCSTQPAMQSYPPPPQQQPLPQRSAHPYPSQPQTYPPYPPQPQMQMHSTYPAEYPAHAGYQQPQQPYAAQQPYSHTIAARISPAYEPQHPAHPTPPQQHPHPASHPAPALDPIPALDFAPPSPVVAAAIDSIVMYIAANGSGAEEYLCGQLNPDGSAVYKFLGSNDQDHEYFRWRQYWHEQGRNEEEVAARIREWRQMNRRPSQPQQQQQPQQPLHPSQQMPPHLPAAPAFVSELHALPSLPPAASLAPALHSEFDGLLRSLDASKERIKAARQWIMRAGRSAEEMHAIFAVLLQFASGLSHGGAAHPAKMPIVFLINDLVLAASKANGNGGGAQENGSAPPNDAARAIAHILFTTLLPYLLPLLATAFVGHTQPEQESVLRIIDWWGSNHLLPRAEIAGELRGELIGRQHAFVAQQQQQPPQQHQPQQLQQPPPFYPPPPAAHHSAMPFHPAPTAAAVVPSFTPVAPVALPTDVLHLTPAFVARLAKAANEAAAQTLRKPLSQVTYTPLDAMRVPIAMPANAAETAPYIGFIQEKMVRRARGAQVEARCVLVI